MSDENTYVVEMKKINKAFYGSSVLEDVCFRLKKGTVHALMGENGAGKSTLMKILGGIYSADSGEIFVEGEKVGFSGPRDGLDAGIAMIHQELAFIPEMTIAENMFLGGNQQKVILAKWLLAMPEILILDEPTRGIDVGAKMEIYHLIMQMAEAGKTILLISSEMEEILGLCDNIVVFHEGRVSGQITGKDATSDKILKLAAGIA